MSRGVGDLNAGGDWAERVREMVATASARYPERAGDILKYGSKLCTPAALARFDQLSAAERGSWDQMMGPDEKIRQQTRARGKRFKERRALKVAHRADTTNYDARSQQPPPPRLLLPSQPRARFPTPDCDVHRSDWQRRCVPGHAPPFAGFSPPFGETLHYAQSPHVVTPHAQVEHVPQQASRTRPRHDYPHAPTIFCPSCDPFDEPPPFVQPAPTVYHPQQREQRDLAQHVLYRRFDEGGEHEQRRDGQQ